MNVLFVFLLLKILELSRYNLAKPDVPRSLYGTLTIILPASLLLYLYMKPRMAPFDQKIERHVARIGKSWLPILLDGAVIVLCVYFIWKTVAVLYTYPISCLTADMLPIIRGTGESLLALENPFDKTFCPPSADTVPFPPMMVLPYLLPQILRLDIRFLSLLCFLGIVLVAYVYHRKKGRNLTGFLLLCVLISSGLFPLLLITVHTFPYLLLFSIILCAVLEEKDKTLFFSLALALAMRKLFWLYAPLFAIYLIRTRKLTLPNLKSFSLGGLLGFSLYILFPSYIFHSSIAHLVFQHDIFQRNLNLEHSIGLTYYLAGNRMLAFIIMLGLYAILCLFAVKYLRKTNLWLFLFLTTLAACYFQANTRAQEYYYLPLLLLVIYTTFQTTAKNYPRKNVLRIFIPAAVSFLLVLLFYPGLSGKGIVINPIRGHTEIIETNSFRSGGYLELSVSWNVLYQRPLVFVIRKTEPNDDEPVRIRVRLNEKEFFNSVYRDAKFQIPLDLSAQREYFSLGANSIVVEAAVKDRYEEFFLSVRAGMHEGSEVRQ